MNIRQKPDETASQFRERLELLWNQINSDIVASRENPESTPNSRAVLYSNARNVLELLGRATGELTENKADKPNIMLVRVLTVPRIGERSAQVVESKVLPQVSESSGMLTHVSAIESITLPEKRPQRKRYKSQFRPDRTLAARQTAILRTAAKSVSRETSLSSTTLQRSVTLPPGV
jgi:hypothetical protein